MIAVIETGGRQYVVQPGQQFTVNRMTAPIGESVEFSDLLGGAPVMAEVIEHTKGDKVTSRKFRNKTRYHRVKGHRQPLTLVRFSAPETKATLKKSAKAKKTSAEA